MPLDDQAILDYIANHPNAGRGSIRRQIAPEASKQTIWNSLKRLVEEGRFDITGKGRVISDHFQPNSCVLVRQIST